MSDPRFDPPPPGEEVDAPGEQRRRYAGLPVAGWGAREVVIGGLIALVGANILAAVVIVGLGLDLEDTAANIAAQIVLVAFLIGTAIVIARRDQVGPGGAFEKLGLTRFSRSALKLAVLVWVAFFAFVIVAGLLFLEPEQEDLPGELGAEQGALTLIVAGALIVLGAPLAEELFFRGFLFAGLRRDLSLWPAALISGGVFGVLHLLAANIDVAVLLAVFGVVLAWLYERTGTLWAPITAHMIQNALAFTVLVTEVA